MNQVVGRTKEKEDCNQNLWYGASAKEHENTPQIRVSLKQRLDEISEEPHT